MSELIGSTADVYRRMWGMVTWTCHICGSERPDDRISIYTKDISGVFELAIGTLLQNVRYCNDCPSCREAAPTKQLVEPTGGDRNA